MLHPSIKKGQSQIHETGIIATQFIPKGTSVWELSKDEKRLTLEELKKLPPEIARLAYQHQDKYIIVTDNSEFMNHSCNPNTWWDGDEKLVARRDIQPEEEVTYDYATVEIDPKFRANWQCNCGSSNCRGTITPNDCLDPQFQKLHQGHLPSWTVEFINQHNKPQSP